MEFAGAAPPSERFILDRRNDIPSPRIVHNLIFVVTNQFVTHNALLLTECHNHLLQFHRTNCQFHYFLTARQSSRGQVIFMYFMALTHIHAASSLSTIRFTFILPFKKSLQTVSIAPSNASHSLSDNRPLKFPSSISLSSSVISRANCFHFQAILLQPQYVHTRHIRRP